MKKYLWIIIALIVLLGSTVLVSANGGPHGGYTATTDACAGCHRTHTATGAKLLISNSTNELCVNCHGSSGLGANTNVEDGIYLPDPDGDPLLGGGFGTYQDQPVTSSHDMDGGSLLAWGNDVDRGETAEISDILSCASCHDPHGSPNYRILKTEINDSEGIQVEQVDEDTKDYVHENWGAGTSSLCAACHSAYHQTAPGIGSNDIALATGGFTHRVDMPYHYKNNDNPETDGFTDASGVNVQVPLAGDNVVCMTCHLPHGSSATMIGIADGGGLPGETAGDDSALLRLDNRGVCQACHQK